MQNLLTVDPPLIQSSVYPGLIEAATPFWKEGRNIAFRDNGIRKVKGGSEVRPGYQAGQTIRAMVQSFNNARRRLYVSTNTQIQLIEKLADNTTVTLDIGNWPTAGVYSQLETWGAWLVATNGIDPVKVWKNGAANTLANLANTPFTKAKIIKRKSPYLLAFNTSNGETMVEWCHTSDIENWAITAATEAGNFSIRDLESGIQAVVELGDRLAVYSNSSLVLGTLVGRPNVFGWRKVLSGIGAVSPRSVVTQGAFNFGLTFNGIFQTDGNQYKWIDDPVAQRWIIDNVDWNKVAEIHGWHDDYLRLVSWFFIDKGNNPQIISYHYESGQFLTGNLAVTAVAARDSWDVPIFAGPLRKPLLWQQADDYEGTNPAFYLRTKPLDFGARDRFKILNMVRVDGVWDLDTDFRVGAVMDPEGEPEWFHSGKLKRENYFADEREATYFVVEFSGTKNFHMTGMEFFGVPGGLAL